MNSFLLFTENMKMADLVLVNPKLLYVFPRFGIHLGFGENSVGDMCKQVDISPSMFLVVCNVYTNMDYLPPAEDLHAFDLSDLIVYLRNSHNDYKKILIPSVKRKILKVAADCGPKGLVLKRFFDGYINEVIKHFDYEEKIVFPYVQKLITSGLQPNFSIDIYEKNHTDIEEKLTELKNILIKYVPEVSVRDNQEALIELFMFEDDLNRHSLIENKIMVPMVSEMEQYLRK